MAKNSIFSGKQPRNPVSYEQWWEQYEARKTTPEYLKKQSEKEEARIKKSRQGKLNYAKRLAEADKDVVYKGRTYSPEANRMRYLMEQLDKGERDRLRKGIYDDSKTQRAIAEKIIEKGSISDEEMSEMKKDAMDVYNIVNREQAKKYGPPKRKTGGKGPKPLI